MPPRRALTEPVSFEDHAQGNWDSAIALVEYGDYECSRTRRSWLRLRVLQRELRGRLLYVFRHFPREAIHPHARLAATVGEAAAVQGEFWTMHDYLLRRQQALSAPNLARYAVDLSLDRARFERDRISGEIPERIERGLISGQGTGVIRTPTFFINSVRHEGPSKLASLRAAVIAPEHGNLSNPIISAPCHLPSAEPIAARWSNRVRDNLRGALARGMRSHARISVEFCEADSLGVGG